MEQILAIYYDPTLENISRYAQLKTLFSTIEGIKKDGDGAVHRALELIAKTDTLSTDQITKLKSNTLTVNGLSDEDRDEHITLNNFSKNVFSFFGAYYKQQAKHQESVRKLIEWCEKMQRYRSGIFNKGAHYDDDPLFDAELKEAIEDTAKAKGLLERLVGEVKAIEKSLFDHSRDNKE